MTDLNKEKLESMTRLRDEILANYNLVVEDICEHEYVIQNLENQLKDRTVLLRETDWSVE